jgi:hypothetical protein
MKYLLASLLVLSLLTLGCSKSKVKTESEIRLSVDPSGYFWLNMMPPVPQEGPSFHAVFKIKVMNVGKGIVKNAVALTADIIKVSDGAEEKLSTLELEPSPSTMVENDILPGEEMTIEYGGSVSGLTQVTPGAKVYGKVFLAWQGGDTIVVTPTDEVIGTR